MHVLCRHTAGGAYWPVPEHRVTKIPPRAESSRYHSTHMNGGRGGRAGIENEIAGQDLPTDPDDEEETLVLSELVTDLFMQYCNDVLSWQVAHFTVRVPTQSTAWTVDTLQISPFITRTEYDAAMGPSEQGTRQGWRCTGRETRPRAFSSLAKRLLTPSLTDHDDCAYAFQGVSMVLRALAKIGMSYQTMPIAVIMAYVQETVVHHFSRSGCIPTRPGPSQLTTGLTGVVPARMRMQAAALPTRFPATTERIQERRVSSEGGYGPHRPTPMEHVDEDFDDTDDDEDYEPPAFEPPTTPAENHDTRPTVPDSPRERDSVWRRILGPREYLAIVSASREWTAYTEILRTRFRAACPPASSANRYRARMGLRSLAVRSDPVAFLPTDITTPRSEGYSVNRVLSKVTYTTLWNPMVNPFWDLDLQTDMATGGLRMMPHLGLTQQSPGGAAGIRAVGDVGANTKDNGDVTSRVQRCRDDVMTLVRECMEDGMHIARCWSLHDIWRQTSQLHRLMTVASTAAPSADTIWEFMQRDWNLVDHWGMLMNGMLYTAWSEEDPREREEDEMMYLKIVPGHETAAAAEACLESMYDASGGPARAVRELDWMQGLVRVESGIMGRHALYMDDRGQRSADQRGLGWQATAGAISSPSDTGWGAGKKALARKSWIQLTHRVAERRACNPASFLRWIGSFGEWIGSWRQRLRSQLTVLVRIAQAYHFSVVRPQMNGATRQVGQTIHVHTNMCDSTSAQSGDPAGPQADISRRLARFVARWQERIDAQTGAIQGDQDYKEMMKTVATELTNLDMEHRKELEHRFCVLISYAHTRGH
jgi:hypothetical protein